MTNGIFFSLCTCECTCEHVCKTSRWSYYDQWHLFFLCVHVSVHASMFVRPVGGHIMTNGIFFFSVSQNELVLPDIPCGIAWVEDNIFFCMKKDVYLTTVSKNTICSCIYHKTRRELFICVNTCTISLQLLPLIWFGLHISNFHIPKRNLVSKLITNKSIIVSSPS